MFIKPLLINHISNVNRKKKKQRSHYIENPYQRKFLSTKINAEHTLENSFFSKLFRVISIEKKKQHSRYITYRRFLNFFEMLS